MKIKRAFIAALTSLSILCVGCGASSEPSDPVAQKVVTDISNLGEITLDDEAAIEKIDSVYSTLTDSQKNQVNNYIDLLNAKDRLEELKVEEANRVSELSKVARVFYPVVNEAKKGLKDSLKNPSSLKITKIIISTHCLYSSSEKAKTDFHNETILNGWHIQFHYTAENGFGNNSSGIANVIWHNPKYYADETIYDSSDIPNGENEAFKEVDGVPGLWKRTSGLDYWVFAIELDDFEKEGYTLN